MIELKVYDVNIPELGGILRGVCLLNSIKPISFQGLQYNTGDFVTNVRKILEEDLLKKITSIEISFEISTFINKGDKDKFLLLTLRQRQEILELLKSRFPNYSIINKSI